jgi:hypothetical protein
MPKEQASPTKSASCFGRAYAVHILFCSKRAQRRENCYRWRRENCHRWRISNDQLVLAGSTGVRLIFTCNKSLRRVMQSPMASPALCFSKPGSAVEVAAPDVAILPVMQPLRSSKSNVATGRRGRWALILPSEGPPEGVFRRGTRLPRKQHRGRPNTPARQAGRGQDVPRLADRRPGAKTFSPAGPGEQGASNAPIPAGRDPRLQ